MIMQDIKTIRASITKLIDEYPEQAKPLIRQHFENAFKALDNIEAHTKELIDLNLSVIKKYDKLKDKYITLQVKQEYKKEQ